MSSSPFSLDNLETRVSRTKLTTETHHSRLKHPTIPSAFSSSNIQTALQGPDLTLQTHHSILSKDE